MRTASFYLMMVMGVLLIGIKGCEFAKLARQGILGTSARFDLFCIVVGFLMIFQAVRALRVLRAQGKDPRH
jgi:hypothetical protein